MSRLQKFLVVAFIVGIAESSAVNPAFSYVIGGGAWPGSPIVIKYSYVNMFDGGILMPDNTPLPNSIIKASIEEALHVWTTAAPINFVQVPDSNLVTLRFRHEYINGPDPPVPALPIAKAQSTCIGASGLCEVQYDDSDRWQVVGTQPVPDILGATIHEVGHVLGLEHTDVTDANMYWIFHRFTGLGTGQLFADDIAGIQAIYGAGTGSVTPLAIPEPTACLLSLAAGGWFLTRRRARSAYSR